MSREGELKKLIKSAQRQGFRHTVLGNNHHRFYAPDGVTIVQCSSTMYDGSWWGKFLTEMRKAGYCANEDDAMEVNGKATTNLGDALREAQAPPERPAPIKGTFTNLIRAAMKRDPQRWFNCYDAASIVRSAGYTYNDTQASIVLASMCKQQEIHRGDKGQYRVAPASTSAATRALLPVTVEVRAEASEDETELDEALAALGRIETTIKSVVADALNDIGRIESVVRKYKTIITQVKQMKQLLENVR